MSHPNRRPSRAVLVAAFKKYQEERIPRMQKILEFSSMVSNVSAWNGLTNKLLALYVFPLADKAAMSNQIGAIIREAPKLDFLPTPTYRKRKIPWRDEVGQHSERPLDSASKTNSALFNVFIVGLLLGLFVVVRRLWWNYLHAYDFSNPPVASRIATADIYS
jgi:hypothetical protein